MSTQSPPPLGFKRHVTAVLGANFGVATALAIYVGALTAIQTHSLPMVLTIATVTWLGVFAIAAPASGLFFTLAFPFLRKAGERKLLPSVFLGAAGGYGSVWSNYAVVAKHASVRELGTATLLGAVLGGAYWFFARRRPEPESPAIDEAAKAEGNEVAVEQA